MRLAAPSPSLLELYSSVTLLRPLAFPSRPPGFEASPTPPLVSAGPMQRTPSPVRCPVMQDQSTAMVPLFAQRQKGLLASPASSRPRPPAAHRKTLAGVKISTKGGLSLQRGRRSGARSLLPRRQWLPKNLYAAVWGLQRTIKTSRRPH